MYDFIYNIAYGKAVANLDDYKEMLYNALYRPETYSKVVNSRISEFIDETALEMVQTDARLYTTYFFAGIGLTVCAILIAIGIKHLFKKDV